MMKVTTEMYTKLFNEITEVQEELIKLSERLKNIQTITEEIYIDNDSEV